MAPEMAQGSACITGSSCRYRCTCYLAYDEGDGECYGYVVGCVAALPKLFAGCTEQLLVKLGLQGVFGFLS